MRTPSLPLTFCHSHSCPWHKYTIHCVFTSKAHFLNVPFKKASRHSQPCSSLLPDGFSSRQTGGRYAKTRRTSETPEIWDTMLWEAGWPQFREALNYMLCFRKMSSSRNALESIRILKIHGYVLCWIRTCMLNKVLTLLPLGQGNNLSLPSGSSATFRIWRHPSDRSLLLLYFSLLALIS